MKITFVNECGDSNLQLTKSWSSVKSVLCGDLLLNGSKQLLHLKDTSFYAWQDSCIISDLSSSNPVDILCQAQDSDVSMSRAIPGLLAKVQKGKSMIAEAESKISKKIEATLDALIRLKDCSSENELHHVSSFQESLVDIILHNDENFRTNKDVSVYTKTLKVLNHWIKCIDNRCIICWTFMNTDEKSIFNPTLLTTIPNQQIQSTQKLFILKCDSFTINDECRRDINPGEKFSVLASLDMPEFHVKDIEMAVILSWYKATSSEFENEIYLPMRDKTLTPHQMNLKAVVSAEHVFKTQLKDISTAEHLACMKVVQQRIVLQVFTLHSDVTQFENILLTTAYGAAHLLLLENSEVKCLVFKSANLPLFGVHMIFNSLSLKTLEIEAFTKDDNESSLLIQFLYQQLPEDIIILPQGTTLSEFHEHQHQAICTMKEEVDLLLSTISIHNVTEKMGPDNLPSLNEAGTVVIPKETFLRVRKALVKKECTTDNVVQEMTCLRFSNDKPMGTD
ncbi:hypothetical protein JTE90_013928 [Oedothorax gibbosus]|uniref:Uncharacterized protein n=1 Tax=Oedothorax gibbosus TaxID=931172 RepID=A0AAV6TL93_9ARAC|nr:hypothetical protein JTE90_013928 [Oedothorax gibbosus]